MKCASAVVIANYRTVSLKWCQEKASFSLDGDACVFEVLAQSGCLNYSYASFAHCRPIWVVMMHKVFVIKSKKNGRAFSLSNSKLFLAVFFWCVFFLFGGSLQASTIEVRSFSLNRVLHFGKDVPDAFKPINGGTNLNGDSLGTVSGLQVLSLGYKSFDTGPVSTSEAAVIVSQETAADAEIPAEVIGKALFYPNPARQLENAKLGYQLSKNMDIELQMYDMMANRIFKTIFPSGTNGGKSGYNKLTLNLETFSGYFLSAGVYFYLIIHDGNVLAKGKVAVIP